MLFTFCFFRSLLLFSGNRTVSCIVFQVVVLIELSLPENLQQIVVNQFSRVAQNNRCSFFGNVTLGSSVSLSDLRQLYDVVGGILVKFTYLNCFTCLSNALLLFEQVVLAYGAESDRVLGIPGEVCLMCL